MSIIKTVRGQTPIFGNNVFLADNSVVIGEVSMGDDCSVWFNAVIRGDVNFIKIGDRVNIQDGAVIHCTFEKSGTTIGNDVSIGHSAIVHGCTIHDKALIGMGAIVMDNAVVPTNCLVAAGAVVLENTILESGYIYAGVPAKKVKELSKENFEFFITRTANNYVMYAEWFKER
ncbi:MAG: gamma carbonic anhydrase family protein [Saprospiraceae bacterium]|nr:gamma carbonic anhydrase family protein [Saprospiraceae bacterium]